MKFFNLLTGPELLQITEAHAPEHRERLYPPTVTLSMFVQQAPKKARLEANFFIVMNSIFTNIVVRSLVPTAFTIFELQHDAVYLV